MSVPNRLEWWPVERLAQPSSDLGLFTAMTDLGFAFHDIAYIASLQMCCGQARLRMNSSGYFIHVVSAEIRCSRKSGLGNI